MLDPLLVSAGVAGVVSLATTVLTKSKCIVECGSQGPCCRERCACCCCDWCRLGFLDAPMDQTRARGSSVEAATSTDEEKKC